MDSIPTTKNATLYNMDCTYLTDVHYDRDSLETVTLIFSEKPPEAFPDRFFLMPEGKLMTTVHLSIP